MAMVAVRKDCDLLASLHTKVADAQKAADEEVHTCITESHRAAAGAAGEAELLEALRRSGRKVAFQLEAAEAAADAAVPDAAASALAAVLRDKRPEY